jgi:hypothetical protein
MDKLTWKTVCLFTLFAGLPIWALLLILMLVNIFGNLA